MTYPSPGPSQFPDAAFSVMDDGDARLMFWSDGTTYRVRGAGLFPNNTPTPVTPVLGSGSTYDRNGNWLLAAFRVPGGDLVAFTHVEDHSFDCPGPYAEWNAGAVVSSADNGVTWARDGLAISDPKPCAPSFGRGRVLEHYSGAARRAGLPRLWRLHRLPIDGPARRARQLAALEGQRLFVAGRERLVDVPARRREQRVLPDGILQCRPQPLRHGLDDLGHE